MVDNWLRDAWNHIDEQLDTATVYPVYVHTYMVIGPGYSEELLLDKYKLNWFTVAALNGWYFHPRWLTAL